ncbi:hypothetical protein O4H66_05300 [Comamonadaceae bacterium G21597-S1]|nr:hypothetical protein [Comamonadaceae bacterium G21597-S1]
MSAATITRDTITPALSVQMGGQARLARHPRRRDVHLFVDFVVTPGSIGSARRAASRMPQAWPPPGVDV